MKRKDPPTPTAAPAPVEAAAAAPARPVSEVRVTAAAARHRLVVFSILMVGGALTTMLFVQFYIGAIGSALIGTCASTVMLLVHDRVRKASEIAALKRDLARTQGAGHGANQGAGHGASHGATYGAARATNAAMAPPNDPDRARSPPQDQNGAQKAPRRRISVLDPEPQPDPYPALANRPVETATYAQQAAPASVGKLSVDPLRDQWSFRPRDPLPAGAAHGATASTAPLSTIESDLALVQRKIKALADEVNAAEPVRSAASAPIDARMSPSAALESSIGALKLAADTMRERPSTTSVRAREPRDVANPGAGHASAAPVFEFAIPATAERIAVSSLPQPSAFPDLPTVDALAASSAVMTRHPSEGDRRAPAPRATAPVPQSPVQSPLASAISHAVETGLMDVMLSPIVGLANHDVSHYEMKVRIKNPDGAYFEDPERDLILAGGEMLALFDAARLQRAAILARRLDARGKGGALLSDVAGASLTNGAFLETFARLYEERERIAGQLVLTFSQSDCEQFAPSTWQALGDMHSFGFRFALDRVQHLDVDFGELARLGFAFVKLEAAALLSGMPSRDRFVTGVDACNRIAGAGLTLIADAVDSEAVRARLFGFGVLFGQGQLFGGARRIAVNPADASSSQAA
ncbi:MAG: EAL domain-containing protein [Hyphomicrobium sp.]